jgi:hypothetical protein
VGRRTPLEMKDCQSDQQVVLTDLRLVLLSLGLL